MSDQSDVKLLPGQVIVDAWDLCLDSPDRRKEKANPYRRAFVHDFEDGLTVNWDNDYPDGVKINHLKEIRAKPRKTMTSPGAIHLTIDGNTKIQGNLNVDGDLKVRLKWTALQRGPAGEVQRTELEKLIFGLFLAKDKEVEVPLDRLLSAIFSLVMDANAHRQQGWRWCKNCGALHHSAKKGVCPAGGAHSVEGSGEYLMPHS
jgi:hypothetical protein